MKVLWFTSVAQGNIEAPLLEATEPKTQLVLLVWPWLSQNKGCGDSYRMLLIDGDFFPLPSSVVNHPVYWMKLTHKSPFI